jgi:hypothetical protein
MEEKAEKAGRLGDIAICCRSCAYFIEMEPDHSRLFSDRYGCGLHGLYDGEVSDPSWQSCPEWQTPESKLRNDRLEELGI